MTDLLDEVAGFRARSTPPDLEDMVTRATDDDNPRHRPTARRRAGAVLAVAAAIAVVVTGVALARRAPAPSGPAATTTSVSGSTPSTSAGRVGLARRFAITGTPSTPITIGISTPGPDVPRLGWEGGGSTDLELTNVTDVPVVVIQPDWDAEGGGVVRSFPCPAENMCQPHHTGADLVIAPGERFLLPIWFEPPVAGTWELTFRFGWRAADDGDAAGSELFTMQVKAFEAPLADDHPELMTTTMPR